MRFVCILSELLRALDHAPKGSALAEPEPVVQGSQRQLAVLLVDHDRDLDLRGRDHLNVDALVGEHR